MHELSRFERAPLLAVVQRFTCDHHSRMPEQIHGMDAEEPAHARAVEVAILPPAGRALEHQQLVSVRIAERPDPVRRGQDEVQSVDRKVLGDPTRSGLQPRGDIAFCTLDLTCDKREEPLRVSVALDQRHVWPELRFQLVDSAQQSVVPEETVMLLERVRVVERNRAARGKPDMRDEGSGRSPASHADKGLILVGRQRAAVNDQTPFAVVVAETRPIRVPPSLHRKAVRGVQEPEGGVHSATSTRHSEEPAHAR